MATSRSRLAEIYKSEKAKGGGLASTLGKRALEKLDPRQIFNQSGFLAAVLPSLFKSYTATPSRDINKIAPASTSESVVSDSINAKLSDLVSKTDTMIVNTQLSAKNSLVLPAMARDMNIMRQNIAKLAKAQGAKPTYSADMFFKGSAEREQEYESKFAKTKSKTTPTPITGEKKEESGGVLGLLGKVLSPLLTIGKTIFDAITKTLGGIGEFLLKGIVSVFSIDNILKAFGLAGNVMTGIIRFLGAVVTNPLFLAIAAGATLFQIMKLLRDEYDEKKARYLELAAKKKEQGALSPEEEAELKKLNSTKLQQAAREELGYDPMLGKETTKTRVQAITTEMSAAEQSLKDEAALQLQSEGVTSPTNEQIFKRAEQLKELRAPVPNDGSYAASEARRFRQTETGEGKMARLGISPSRVEGGRGIINPPSVSPTPVSDEPSEELVNFIKQKENPNLAKEKGTSKAYWDYKQYSIGYGTKAENPDEVITEEEADKRLREALTKSQKAVIAHAAKHNYDFNQNQVNALSSFVFNLGPGILDQLTANGTRSVEEIANKIPEYNKAGGKVNRGLVARRQVEFDMFTAAPEPTLAAAPAASMGASVSAAPEPTLVGTPIKPPMGSAIAAATTEVAKEKLQIASAPPVVINAPTTNVQNAGNRQGSSVQIAAASVVDTDFMKYLVDRLSTI